MDQIAIAGPLHSIRSRAGSRVAATGLAASLLALAAAGVAPERLQFLVACSCIAFALIFTSVLVLAADAAVRWRGLSPVLAIVIGVLAGGLPGVLTYRGSHSEARPTRWHPVSTPTWTVAHPSQPVAAAPVAPPPDIPRAAAPRAAVPLNPVLADIGTLLGQRARPALDNLYATLMAAAGYEAIDPGLGAQLEPNVTALANVQASLDRLQADNPDLASELQAALGSTRALTSVTSSLHQFIQTAAARGTATGQLRRLAGTVEMARQWVDASEQRLAGAQALEQPASDAR